MKIFVGNLSYSTRDEDLRAAFAAFGEVSEAVVITDRETQRSRGFGFVEMADGEAAKNAISSLNGQEIGGRAVTVSEARPRENREGGQGGGGRGPRAGGSRGGYGGGGSGRSWR